MIIWCCQCAAETTCEKVTGEVIYPHRPDLFSLSFWQCTCGNYVGCHKRDGRPLGVIPGPEMRTARSKLHELLDPLWKSGGMTRTRVYETISKELGYEYHTAEVRTIAEVEKVLAIIEKMKISQ